MIINLYEKINVYFIIIFNIYLFFNLYYLYK
uniref:Uncharacterized protein n=1 Tax=viral metagenome TaxID=1070528 RepID=A0A6C0KPB5_9ZZZZ